MPSHEELQDYGERLLAGAARRTSSIYEYPDATKGVDDGFYTCVIMHGPTHDPVYSSAQCEVIIKDLCEEDSGCADNEICEPDYTTGTVECTCNYQCPQSFNVLCSDTCEMFWHECAMEQKICEDGRKREVGNIGFCPERVEPQIRDVDQDIEEELGNQVTLSSGLLQDGTPAALVQWTFYPASGSPVSLSARETYEFTVSEDTVGTYKITLMQCMDEANAVENVYRFGIKEVTTTVPVIETTTPTPTPQIGELTTPGYTCSAFPGGIIEDFNSVPHFYDLSCTHILAADLMPEGSFLNPWFVYGTFDEHDSKTALMTMTFYLGQNQFEVQRGWIVHIGDGEKLALEEGVVQVVEGTDCSVKFADMLIEVQCLHFEAYYDGLMAGHIRLKTFAGSESLAKGRGNLGICYDNNSGWRPNWQIGKMRGKCRIDREEPACKTELPEMCQLSQPPQIFGRDWTSCGMGAESSCKELNCDGTAPTQAQQCVLEKANRVNCNLKLGGSVAGEDSACPTERCKWMKGVVSKGCPQDNLPFDCP